MNEYINQVTPMPEEKPSYLYYHSKKGKKGVDAFTLKIIAITVMFIDHFAVVFIERPLELMESRPQGLQYLDLALRLIGRIGFPIFAYMITEGARRTHNMPKYMRRLLIFGLISELPFDIAFFCPSFSEIISGQVSIGELFTAILEAQNVYWTLLLGLISIWFIQKFRDKKAVAVLGCIGTFLIAETVTTDYAGAGVLCIIVFYIFGDKKPSVKIPGYLLAIIVCCIEFVSPIDIIEAYRGDYLSPGILIPYFNQLEVAAVFSLPFILRYNGERGKYINKYVFYGFYPAHITVLYLLYILISLIR